MSYCRWSSNDFQCDVYVLETTIGFEIHVASNRVIWDPPPPPDVPLDPDNLLPWIKRHQEVMARMEEIDRVDIGGPYDGHSVVLDTPGEAAAYLLVLQGSGYVVPDDVITVLDEEQEELDAADL